MCMLWGCAFFLDCHLDCFYLFMLFNAICSLVEASEKQSLCFQTSSTSSRGLQACLTCQSSPTSKQFREENFTSEKQFFCFCLFCIVMQTEYLLEYKSNFVFIFFVISNFYPILLSCLEEWLVKGTVKISHAHISLSPLRAYKCSVRIRGVGIFQYDFFRGNSALGLFG